MLDKPPRAHLQVAMGRTCQMLVADDVGRAIRSGAAAHGRAHELTFEFMSKI